MTRVVIDIPEKEYQACVLRDANMTGSISDSYIANGTILHKGDWIINPDTRTMKCSRCGAIENADRWLVEDMNYCHCCGSDLRGAENEKEKVD